MQALFRPSGSSFLAKLHPDMNHKIMTIPYFSIFLCLGAAFPALAGEIAFPKLTLDGHVNGNAAISCQIGFLAKIKHDE